MPESLQKQHRQNCFAYIMAYALVGVMNGLIYDALITYLMAVSPAAAKSIASYMGMATFAAAAAAALAPKVGYKKVMMAAAMVAAASLMLISGAQSRWGIPLGLLSLMTATSLFDVMLPPFIAAYTAEENRTSMFAAASFAAMLGLALGTAVGGPVIVRIFSLKLEMSYAGAKLLTKSLGSLSPEQYAFYIGAHRTVIMAFAAISLFMLVSAFFIKENGKCFDREAKAEARPAAGFSGAASKYVILFMVYSVLGRFAAVLIAPQVSIYLTKLGIDRAAVSFLGTLQYFAILAFMLFSAKIVRKMGRVYAIVLLSLASLPFMIILANGSRYGSKTVLIVGAALFFRAGLANAAVPAVNSLTMALVPESGRSLYASVIFVMQSFAQIAAGQFARAYLFVKDSGYANAYYYAAALYIIAHAILLLFFPKEQRVSRAPHGENAMERSQAES